MAGNCVFFVAIHGNCAFNINKRINKVNFSYNCVGLLLRFQTIPLLFINAIQGGVTFSVLFTGFIFDNVY